jgi:hypothetical protein
MVGIAQQGNGLQHTDFHPQGGDGHAQVLMKQPAQMPATAPKPGGQIAHGQIQDLCSRQALKHLDQVLLSPDKTNSPNSLPVRLLEFLRQDVGDDSE